MSTDDTPNWDAIDRQRLSRHETLLGIWRDLPANEILTDVGVAVQLAMYKTTLPTLRREILTWAKAAVAHGAGHDCEEWRDEAGTCRVCGQVRT